MNETLSEVVGEDVNLTPETEAQPETAQVEAPAQEPQVEEPPKTVPLAALHEERQRRKELAAQIERERQERETLMRRFEERLNALMPKEQVPDFQENPAEHLRHQLQNVNQSTQATQQQLAELRQQQQARELQEQLTRSVAAAEQQMVAEKPDYYQAVNYVRSQRIAELQVLGLDETQAAQQAQQELAQAAYLNAYHGRSPAQVAYQLALAKGYRPQASDGQQKLEAQQKGQAAAKTLGTGGAPKTSTPVQALLSMSDDEFAEATKGNLWSKLMGG